jgi:hypothetical protein
MFAWPFVDRLRFKNHIGYQNGGASEMTLSVHHDTTVTYTPHLPRLYLPERAADWEIAACDDPLSS